MWNILFFNNREIMVVHQDCMPQAFALAMDQDLSIPKIEQRPDGCWLDARSPVNDQVEPWNLLRNLQPVFVFKPEHYSLVLEQLQTAKITNDVATISCFRYNVVLPADLLDWVLEFLDNHKPELETAETLASDSIIPHLPLMGLVDA